MLMNYSECLGWFYRRYPEHIKEYVQSVSPKQIICKKWLVDELKKVPNDFKNIQLYGGWFGYPLIDMLHREYKIETLHNFDCDIKATRTCNRFSEFYFKHNYVKAYCNKVEQVGDTIPDVDLVINTSSEHMPDLPELIKNKNYSKTCVFALQSNNMSHIEDHTNCVNSHEELAEKSGLRTVLYSGVMKLDNYERYLTIGLN